MKNKRISHDIKTVLLFFLIICLATVLRFIYLDRIPNAVGGDELTYIVTAKSIFLTGRDITGTWSPWSIFLFRYPPNEQQAELPYFLHLPFSGPFPFSLFTARFPFALLSVGVVILLCLLTQKLINRQTAFVAGLIASINPWLIYIGRTAYETTPATFFYLLGFYLLLAFRGPMLLVSIPVFILAFYSYIGMKLIFLPLIILFCLFAWSRNRKDQKQYLMTAIISFIFTISFLLIITTKSDGSRISELFLPNNPQIASTVDAIRKNTMSNPFTPFFVNKFSVYLQFITTKFYRMFSPVYLFLEGDQFFSLYRHGFFYALDFVFLAGGFLVLFLKKRSVFFLLSSTIVLATFPHLFHKTQTDFSYHIALLFPISIIVIGNGIYGFIQSVPKRFRVSIGIAVTILYIISAGNFLFIYFFQHPLGGYFDFHMRIVSRYIELSNKVPITVYSPRYTDFFKKYLFYSNSLKSDNVTSFTHLYDSQSLIFNNITFSSCNDKASVSTSSGIVIADIYCILDKNIPRVSISNLSDAGEVYQIYNDPICINFNLKRYPTGISLADFAIERLEDKRFCEAFINRF